MIGLNRAAIQSCSSWSSSYRIMGAPFPGPWTFKYHPWTKEMHDSKAPLNVGMKAAQMGFTETALNIAFFSIDILKHDVLYVLPSEKPDANNFSASRFNQALELSPHLKDLFSDVMNVGHKRAGTANLYIRGSQSRSALKSIPTPKIIFDEVEEMCLENIPLAFERTSGQREEDVLIWMLSTPMLHKVGIHQYYLDTTQEHYMFPCPSCNRIIELTFPSSLIMDGDKSHLICTECRSILPHETKEDWLRKAYWQPTAQSEARGFHVSQLYSKTVSPKTLAKAFERAQSDPAQEQEFFNSKLGLPHEVKGARVMDQEIQACKSSDVLTELECVCMGVDVGAMLHVVISNFRHYDEGSIEELLLATKVEHFHELEELIQRFNVRCTIIDANPETRKVVEICKKFPGKIFRCYYGNALKGKTAKINEEAQSISVDRTSWLDASLSRFKTNKIKIPINIPEEFINHIKSLVRVYQDDKTGGKVARYVNTEADHYAHAHNYCEIAYPLAFNLSASVDIRGNVL